MRAILKHLLQRISPPMLRSNSPDRPMVVRRQNWLLQETRFLFLTRKGPVEIILKPSLILGIGFIGLVGITVIGATTLFVGFKSVEVVRNESITTAEASAPPMMMDSADTQKPAAATAGDVPALAPAAAAVIEPVIPELDTPPVTLAMSAASVPPTPWPPSSAATDSVRLPPLPAGVPPARDDEASEELAMADNYAEPEALIPVPPLPDLPDDDAGGGAASDVAGKIAGIFQVPNIMSLMDRDSGIADDDVEVIAMAAPMLPPVPHSSDLGQAELDRADPNQGDPNLGDPNLGDPNQEDSGLEPFNPDNNLPVVTDASRQYKLLRSMAREIRGIRQSLTEVGLPEDNLPALNALDNLVETADFARLAMAVEDHRSLLRKVPLKPPMLYFYISSKYGVRRHPVLKTKRFHHGIDLAGTWQETVHAPAPGTVIFAGQKGSFGKVVQVRHAYGIVTTYAHLAKINVRRGADVVNGTVVGKMGRTGRVDGAHLHYEIRLGDTSIDPQKFFDIGHRIGVGGELMLATDQP